MYSFYYCLINDYCLIIDRRTQVLFFIFLLTLTSDRRGLSIFALKMTLAPLPPTAQKMETENNEQRHHLALVEMNINDTDLVCHRDSLHSETHSA